MAADGDESEWAFSAVPLTVDGEHAPVSASRMTRTGYPCGRELQAAIAQPRRTAVNVKFLIEGEEEIGSPHLPGYAHENARELAANGDIVTGPQWRRRAALSVASNGWSRSDQVEGARDDMHSGRYGGTVANPAKVLQKSLAKLARPDGSVASPGFSEGHPAEREGSRQLDAVPLTIELSRADRGPRRPTEEREVTPPCSACGEPTLRLPGWQAAAVHVIPPRRAADSSRAAGGEQRQAARACAVRGHVERIGTRG